MSAAQRVPPPSASAVPGAAVAGAQGSRLGSEEERRGPSHKGLTSAEHEESEMDDEELAGYLARIDESRAPFDLLDEDFDGDEIDVERELERLGIDAGARWCASQRGLL